MVEAGITQGLDRDVAEALAKQTLIGAGRLLESSGATPGELRARVSSKGGTTLAALEAMSHAGLQTTVAVGLAAADRRSRELAAELAGRVAPGRWTSVSHSARSVHYYSCHSDARAPQLQHPSAAGRSSPKSTNPGADPTPALPP